MDLCNGHYAHKLTGQPLRPLAQRRPMRASLIRDELGRKQCNRCHAWLPESAFYKNNKALDGLSPPCRDCTRKSQIENLYGISWEQYEGLLVEQAGACAICRTRVAETEKRMAVDHDHTCCPGTRSCGACVRGLLCNNCNAGLGYFGDDPSRLAAAVDYLRRIA